MVTFLLYKFCIICKHNDNILNTCTLKKYVKLLFMRKHFVQQLKQKLFGLVCTKIPVRIIIENFSVRNKNCQTCFLSHQYKMRNFCISGQHKLFEIVVSGGETF